jgi:hypothetical protein
MTLRAVTAMGLVLLAGCGKPAARPVEDLSGGRDLSRMALTSIQGTRDGDRLDVRAVYSEGGNELTVDLHFAVGAPTRLSSGTWSGLGSQGLVRERSVTFLGGQSGPPSLGGRFDLVGSDGNARFRVTIPVQELRIPLKL